MSKQTVLVALGGNAILQPKQEANFQNQYENVKTSCQFLAKLVHNGYNIVVTHGNGPQVGTILRQNEEASHVVPAMPLDVCSAESQGFIAYMMQQALHNELNRIGSPKHVVSVVTRTEVSADDPAFANPDKPIGVFYSEEEAKKLSAEKGWTVAEDAGRGWRRVVPSPTPLSIVESASIVDLINGGHIVISCGGGGIPVVKKADGSYQGVEAVVDKDRSGCKLAEQIQADIFVILTDVEHVYINYGKENQKALTNVTLEELEGYIAEGQFSAGSMGPKIEAAYKFAKQGGTAIICALNKADLALEGKSGTRITQ
ncbi:carbamate kinase [Brevibacillus ruminantium]|uniref:Carbamate kinase n=1 Tax=Brevibacillus ruminantium TaxID=2950604 RepID=A0ABY4WAX6_9BACL|nr:carbamate kinase [Brevibacillus ruminantium]USG64325.1 carbamate kinase [Brevibacillus ruminantium]